MIVLSPHLDDAVFACGALLAAHPRSTVVTLFAGRPPGARDVATDWDRRCGFADAGEAIEARRAEDACALGLLAARPVWLDFCDAQYGRTPSLETLAATMRATLASLPAEALLLPLGLFHSDHVLAHDAALAALRALPPRALLCYEDALYRGLDGLLQQRLAALARAGWQLTPAAWPPADAHGSALKAEAVRCYASQLRAFGDGGHDDLARAERCWRLDPPSGDAG